jgi:hypothetical protein
MRKVKKWKLTGIFVCVIAMVLTSCHEKATDYSQKSNWLNQPEITKDVDAFYIYSTSYFESSFEKGASDYASLDNAEMREGAQQEYFDHATVFEESCNVFTPWYRQFGMRYAGEVMAKTGSLDEAVEDTRKVTDNSIDKVIVDGAYQSKENRNLASDEENGFELVANGLQGKP